MLTLGDLSASGTTVPGVTYQPYGGAYQYQSTVPMPSVVSPYNPNTQRVREPLDHHRFITAYSFRCNQPHHFIPTTPPVTGLTAAMYVQPSVAVSASAAVQSGSKPNGTGNGTDSGSGSHSSRSKHRHKSKTPKYAVRQTNSSALIQSFNAMPAPGSVTVNTAPTQSRSLHTQALAVAPPDSVMDNDDDGLIARTVHRPRTAPSLSAQSGPTFEVQPLRSAVEQQKSSSQSGHRHRHHHRHRPSELTPATGNASGPPASGPRPYEGLFDSRPLRTDGSDYVERAAATSAAAAVVATGTAKARPSNPRTAKTGSSVDAGAGDAESGDESSQWRISTRKAGKVNEFFIVEAVVWCGSTVVGSALGRHVHQSNAENAAISLAIQRANAKFAPASTTANGTALSATPSATAAVTAAAPGDTKTVAPPPSSAAAGMTGDASVVPPEPIAAIPVPHTPSTNAMTVSPAPAQVSALPSAIIVPPPQPSAAASPAVPPPTPSVPVADNIVVPIATANDATIPRNETQPLVTASIALQSTESVSAAATPQLPSDAARTHSILHASGTVHHSPSPKKVGFAVDPNGSDGDGDDTAGSGADSKYGTASGGGRRPSPSRSKLVRMAAGVASRASAQSVRVPKAAATIADRLRRRNENGSRWEAAWVKGFRLQAFSSKVKTNFFGRPKSFPGMAKMRYFQCTQNPAPKGLPTPAPAPAPAVALSDGKSTAAGDRVVPGGWTLQFGTTKAGIEAIAPAKRGLKHSIHLSQIKYIHVGQLTRETVFRTIGVNTELVPYESGVLLSPPTTLSQFDDWLCVSLLCDRFSVDIYTENVKQLCTVVLGLQRLCRQTDASSLDHNCVWTHGALLWKVFTAKRLSIARISNAYAAKQFPSNSAAPGVAAAVLRS